MSANRTVASVRSMSSAACSERICSWVHWYSSTKRLVGTSASGRVREQDDARAERARLDQAQVVRVDPVAEQVLAAAQDDRVDEQPVLVDQVVAQQLVDQVRAAVHQQVAARLRLQRPDLGGHVARDDRRVAPVGPLERVRHDVLRDAVHPVGQFGVAAAGRRPERRPDLPGPAAQQERVGRHRLGLVVDLVLVVLDAQRPRVPAAPVLVEPGRLDDAVDGHERGHDQPHGRKTSRHKTPNAQIEQIRAPRRPRA